MEGSTTGQQGTYIRADLTSVDTDVNVHIIPKGNAGVNLYSNGALQAAFVGPSTTSRYLVVAGGTNLNDPLIAVNGGGSIRMDDSILVGPPGGNFGGLFGSTAGGASVAVRADNVTNPGADINIDLVPKGNAGVNMYSNGALQASASGPAGALRAVVISGSVAGNPIIQTLGGGVVQIPNLNMTGVPTAPTATPGTNTTQVATTAFVQAAAGPGLLSSNNTWTGFNTWTASAATFQGLTGGAASIYMQNFQNAPGAPNLVIQHSRGATLGTHAAVQVNDPLGQISFLGSDGSAFARGANIFCFCEAAPVAGRVPSYLRFDTDDGTFIGERMRINKDGVVTIGPNATPWAKFTSTETSLVGSNGTTSAQVGQIGEFIQPNKTASSGSLTASVIGTYHSITLTAGDWDVWMHSTVIAAATPGTMEMELVTGATLSGNNLTYVITQLPVGSASHSVDIQPIRFLLTSTTTINLNYRVGVTGTSIANAYIAARRRR
jgi:hypothetical protein